MKWQHVFLCILVILFLVISVSYSAGYERTMTVAFLAASVDSLLMAVAFWFDV